MIATESGGQIYTSTDSGITWIAHDSNRQWGSVASSADGNRLVAADSTGQLYASTDSGVTWTAHDSARNWSCVASSADGGKLVAAENGGRLYTSVGGTTSGATGWLRGGQFDAVELQFVGNGLFVPLSFTNGSSAGIVGN